MVPSADRRLTPHLSRAGVWAFALGTSIGWGSLVVTANTYLVQAGPLGTTLGLVLGAAIMLIIARNYAYLMNCYPDAGGAYAYTREAFGYDHGFLTSWFLLLTYLAMLWANATSLPLFVRYFLGDVFEFGKLYTVFGYDIYLGEALLSLAAVALIALVCARAKRALGKLMVGMVVFFAMGLTVCFSGALGQGGASFSPAFAPDTPALSQIILIAVISPWAFIGFESVSHGAEEFEFKQSGIGRILVVSVITITLLYVFVTLLSCTAYPDGYASWVEYLADLGNLSGIEGLPAFYAASRYLGSAGVAILMLALLCLILTSLIGNIFALSRLIYALGKDRILPPFFAKLNDQDNPANAVWLVAGISLVIPFIGRTAIGWIVDVTTLGATLIYGMVSGAALKTARFRNDRTERITGTAGVVIMAGFGLYLLVPNLFASGSFETESYFLFVVWSVLGFIFFRIVLNHDTAKHFGKSIIVWVALLSLVLFVSLVWMNQSIMAATNEGLSNLEQYYRASGLPVGDGSVIAQQMAHIRAVSARSIVVVVVLFALSLGVLLNNYRLMSKQAERSELRFLQMQDAANKDPLTGVRSKLAYAECEREIDARIARGEGGEFAVAVCDVNGLKAVNDTLGHKAGDEYIQRAAQLICECFDHSPVFRTGGDEFVAVLSGVDFENREAIAQVMHDRSAANIEAGDVSVAVGISDYRAGEDAQLKDVFERADTLMYEEKKRLKGMGLPGRA